MPRKLVIVFCGIVIGLIAVLILNRLFEGLLAWVILNSQITFVPTISGLSVNFDLNKFHSIYIYTFLISSPLLASILMIELSGLLARKNSQPDKKTIILIFQLINTGYIITELTFGIITVISAGQISSMWSPLLNFGNFSFTIQLLFMLFLLFIFFTYLNIQIARIRKSIPVIQKNKT